VAGFRVFTADRAAQLAERTTLVTTPWLARKTVPMTFARAGMHSMLHVVRCSTTMAPACAKTRRGSSAGLRVAQKAPSPRARKTYKNAGIRPRGAEKQA
jgi:hypothetical protein